MLPVVLLLLESSVDLLVALLVYTRTAMLESYRSMTRPQYLLSRLERCTEVLT
jgi:hypothetical protein